MYRKEYPTLVSDLAIDCQILYEGLLGSHRETCYGIWDTGSFHTAISTRFAKQLEAIVYPSETKVQSLMGTQIAGETNVSVFLGELVIPHINVLVLEYKVEAENNYPDILIGMDIISRGKFEVDCMSGHTIVSFDVKRDEQGNPLFQQLVYRK